MSNRPALVGGIEGPVVHFTSFEGAVPEWGRVVNKIPTRGPFMLDRIQGQINGHTIHLGKLHTSPPFTDDEHLIADGLILKLPSDAGACPLRPIVQERDEQSYDDEDKPMFDDDGNPIMHNVWGLRVPVPILYPGGELNLELVIDPEIAPLMENNWRVYIALAGTEHVS